MKVFELRDWSLDGLTLTQRPVPVPGPGEVLIRMKAAALNYRDLLVPQRGYGALTGELPLIPVSDGVGEVVRSGGDVSRVKVGDRVCPMFMPFWIAGEPNAERLTRALGGPLDGVMTEYMLMRADSVCIAPAHLSDEEAATLPCAALTAWSALATLGGVKAGDTVLVQGTGGVSLFALQFARVLGARVIVISGSDEKLARARELGADEGLNYRSVPQWGKAVRDRFGQVDHVVEVGGEQTLVQSLHAVRAGGTLSLIGVLSGGALDAKLGPIVTRQIRLQGVTVGNRDGFEAMCRAIAHHRLKPVVDQVHPFESLREALARLASGAHFGKICLSHVAAA